MHARATTGHARDGRALGRTGCARKPHLHHERAIEVQKDRAQGQHLLAVVSPARLHQREECQHIRRLAEQRFQLGLYVFLTLRAQTVIHC